MIPEKDSPFWPWFRVTSRTVVLLAGLYAFYDRMDPRDAKLMLLCVFADAGLTTIAARFKAKPKDDEKDKDDG